MLLDILNNGDFCPIFATLLILLWIGRTVADQNQQRWGGFLAIVAFLAYTGYALHTFPLFGAEGMLDLTLRSVAAGGLALGISWIVLPLVSMLVRGLILFPLAKIKNYGQSVGERIKTRNERRQQEELLRQTQAEYERSTPERERARMEAEARTRAGALAQKRREDARTACELLFHRHSHVLAGRFHKETFADLVQKYMGDNRPPEEVEERGKQLQDIMLQHVHQIEPPDKPYAIESLTEWYKKTKELIEGLPVDQRYKQAQLAQLNARYAELMQELMENLQP